MPFEDERDAHEEADMTKIKVSISINDTHLEQINEVKQRLEAAGMDVEQTLQTVGVISGSINSDQINQLYQIEGVQQVEPVQRYQTPPPSSDIQ
ncbi:MAG TPA: hypothetical protein V6C65_07560 [Allocoleopsis sp.]